MSDTRGVQERHGSLYYLLALAVLDHAVVEQRGLEVALEDLLEDPAFPLVLSVAAANECVDACSYRTVLYEYGRRSFELTR